MSTAFQGLEQFIQDNECHFLAISEHWLNQDQLISYSLPGFLLVSSFCRPLNRHGGTAIFIRDYFKRFFVRTDICKLSAQYIFECCAVQCKVNNNLNLIVICVYRSSEPNLGDIERFFEKLALLLDILNGERSARFVIVEDFNVDILKPNHRDTQTLLSVLHSYGLQPIVSEPTREALLSSSCLDNIFTNVEGGQVRIMQPHLSDHKAISINFNINSLISPKAMPSKRRNFSSSNIRVFLSALTDIDWSVLYDINRQKVEDMWSCFSSIFNGVFADAFPTVSFRASSGRLNFCNSDPQLLEIKRQLDILYTMSRVDPLYLDQYRVAKKYYDRRITQLKRAHYGSLIKNSSNKSKMTWSIVRDLTGKRHTEYDHFPAGNPEDVANKFNQFFSACGTSCELSGEGNTCGVQRNESSFYVFQVTARELVSMVIKMKNSSSCGFDGISMKIVKKCIHIIAEPLSFIINRSFVEGIFPDALKMAIIKPLFKKGSKADFGNYRPISLLATFSKVFEKILCVRLVSFFRKFNIFNPSQHGFISNKSTETAIFDLLRKITEVLDGGDIPLGVFLDLSKAFDSVNHRKLLDKLEHYGIRDRQLDLIRSYLTNRVQKVELKYEGSGYLSDEIKITSGVPQGSVLGPLLFIVYINDLPRVIDSPSYELSLYADDTNVVVCGNSVSSVIEGASEVFGRIGSWCSDNDLKLNSTKTELVFFHTDRSRHDFPSSLNITDDCNVPVGTSVRFLGLFIDSTLKWHVHVDSLNRKLLSVNYSINVLKRQVDVDILKTVYYANFESRLAYGIIFWGGSISARRLFVTQKMALRLMLRMHFRESCRNIFRDNNILTVTGLFVYKSLQFVSKHKYLFNKFQNINNTRQVHTFHLPRLFLTQSQNSVLYSCMKLYNSLPKSMRDLDGAGSFDFKVRRFLVDCEPYCLDEYYDYCSIRH